MVKVNLFMVEPLIRNNYEKTNLNHGAERCNIVRQRTSSKSSS